MSDYLDKRANASKIVRYAVSDIYSLASAFRTTGNSKVADDLDSIGKDVQESSDLYEQSFSELFDNAFRATQQATANMVQVALNVALRQDK